MQAIALISGGLDSILASRLIQEQGIQIIPLHFKIPFCQGKSRGLEENLGRTLKIVDIGKEFLDLLSKPKHGFGANMNPCIDCKILMLAKAKELLKEWHAAFVVTGEVLGQRPMSQHKRALEIIEQESGLAGLLLRPLSAKLLPQTLPEKEGWVAREKLLGLSGRMRKPQMALAKHFQIENYPNPAGGCLLTDRKFSKRLKDLIAHQELDTNNVELLKIGRHFRLGTESKLVVGRNEGENTRLVNLAKDKDYLFLPGDTLAGPTSLGRGLFNKELIRLACQITCSYCDLNSSPGAEIIYRLSSEKEGEILNVLPIEKAELENLRI